MVLGRWPTEYINKKQGTNRKKVKRPQRKRNVAIKVLDASEIQTNMTIVGEAGNSVKKMEIK